MSAAVTDSHLALAREMAARASDIVLPSFKTGVTPDAKADLSPVTKADRDTEAALRKLINARFPEHGVLGEEYGPENLDADYVWVLDPIDGTKSFVIGKPLFGTLIALAYEGRPVLGVMEVAALKETWIGAEGRPTTVNGAPVSTRDRPVLADAWLLTTSPQMHEGQDFQRFETLRRACGQTIYGGDCYAYTRVAAGRADIVCESSMRPYDYAALAPIVEGAGGRVTDWKGDALGLEGSGHVLASGSASLHESAIDALSA